MSEDRGGRSEREEYGVTIPLPLSLRAALDAYYTGWARSRKRAGEAVPAGELRGPARALERALAWLASLSDDDLGRIQADGGQLLQRIKAMGPDYEGPLPFERRATSVLVVETPPGEGRAGHGAGAIKPPKRGGKPKRMDDAVAATDAPVRVR